MQTTKSELLEIIRHFEANNHSRAYELLDIIDFGQFPKDLNEQLHLDITRRHWVSICDLLEYEYIPALESPFEVTV